MEEPNFQLFSSSNFVPEKCNWIYSKYLFDNCQFADVKDISHNYVGGSELKNLSKKIQTLSEETSNSLKKNVYQNYVQFIDTAKEISRILL